MVGTDPPSDLAVLKIDGDEPADAPARRLRQGAVGDVVLAVGNPLGIGQTVTMGIVSAKGRATGAGDGSYEDFIQTDAPINQGNSGGALVNTQGELIGINSQILSPSGGNIGIGFAIPANMARNVMQQLIDTATCAARARCRRPDERLGDREQPEYRTGARRARQRHHRGRRRGSRGCFCAAAT